MMQEYGVFLSEGNKNTDSKRQTHHYVHGSFTDNSQGMEATKMSVNWHMGKEVFIHIHTSTMVYDAVTEKIMIPQQHEWIFGFWRLRCMSSSSVLDRNPFSDILFANILSCSVFCLFILWMLSFAIYKSNLKMNQTLQCKAWSHETPSRKHRQYTLWHQS